MTKVLVITEMAFEGSGYYYISVPLLTELSKMGHEVRVVGLSYKGEEHNYPFSIIPCKDTNDAHAIVHNLHVMPHMAPDVIVVALDIPMQIMFFEKLAQYKKPYIAITPLENGPLTMSWTAPMFNFSWTFFISELGKQEALKAGLKKVDHILIGIDSNFWHVPTPDEKKGLRKGMGIEEDEFVILTVADNQERKNLWAALSVTSELKKRGRKVRHILVTRVDSPFGWKIRDLAMTLGINQEVMTMNRGMSRESLWSLYALSDLFLLTSKAEGLCVLPDTRVWTGDGLRNIQDIERGDWVVADDGELHLVTETFEREVSENVQIIDMGFGLEPIRVTSNHPVLSVKNYGRSMINSIIGRRLSSLAYIPASELQKGDFVYYPKPKEYDAREVFVSDYAPNVKVVNGLAYALGRNQFGSEFIHPSKVGVVDKVEIDEDFCSLLGWFVAEGCDTKEGLSFSLHWDEVSYREHIRRILKEKFNLELHDGFRSRNRYDGRVYGSVLGRFFSGMCGKDATQKHLPTWALWLDEEKSWALLEAMFSGDGTYSENDANLRYSTASKELSRQLQFILFRLGVVSSVRDSWNRLEYVVTVRRPEIFKVPFLRDTYIPSVGKAQKQFIELDDGWLIPIRSNTKEYYTGYVYNLEVDKRHSYLLAGGVVHNCLPVMEAMSSGLPVVGTDTGAVHELLEDGRGFLIAPEYEVLDVWGNSRRAFFGITEGANVIESLSESPLFALAAQKARSYIEGRSWDVPAKQLHEKILELTNEKIPSIS
jgi:intein/homing endonuclease